MTVEVCFVMRNPFHAPGIPKTWKFIHELSGFRQKGFKEPAVEKP
jgi:hypothetical protein